MSIPTLVVRFALEGSPAIAFEHVDDPETATRLGWWFGGDAHRYGALISTLTAMRRRAGDLDDCLDPFPQRSDSYSSTTPGAHHGRVLDHDPACPHCALVLVAIRAVEWAPAGSAGRCHAFRRGAEVAICGVDAGGAPEDRHHADDCPGHHSSCASCAAAIWASVHAAKATP